MEETTVATNETPGGNELNAEPEQPATSALFDEGGSEPSEKAEAQAPEDTGSEKGAEESGAPIKAEDIKIPEGFEYDKELGDSFLGVVNDEKLSRKELAQKSVDMAAALLTNQQTKMLEALKASEMEQQKKDEAEWAQTKAEWRKQCEADKEYGGQKWAASQAVFDRAARALPEAMKVLQACDLHEHPEIRRMVYRLGQFMGEDQSNISGSGNGRQLNHAEAIFGESLKGYMEKRRGEF